MKPRASSTKGRTGHKGYRPVTLREYERGPTAAKPFYLVPSKMGPHVKSSHV